jgi:hypothetical protein
MRLFALRSRLDDEAGGVTARADQPTPGFLNGRTLSRVR